MPNPENLIAGGGNPVENGRKGGQAFARNQLARKSFKETVQAMLYSELDPKHRKALAKLGYKFDDKNEKGNMMQLAIARCVTKIIATGNIGDLQKLSELGGLHIPEQQLNIGGTSRPIINLIKKDFPSTMKIVHDIIDGEITEVKK